MAAAKRPEYSAPPELVKHLQIKIDVSNSNTFFYRLFVLRRVVL